MMSREAMIQTMACYMVFDGAYDECAQRDYTFEELSDKFGVAELFLKVNYNDIVNEILTHWIVLDVWELEEGGFDLTYSTDVYEYVEGGECK